MRVTLESIRGKVIDVDSHESVPIPRWKDVFGDRAQKFIDANQRVFAGFQESFGNAVGQDAEDAMPITPETVWEVKFDAAPSAGNIDRRPAVLDEMGIHRQLVFPGLGLLAFAVANGAAGNTVQATKEEIDSAWPALDAYNEWAGSVTSKYPDRLRVVGVLGTGKPGLTVDGLIAETKRLIKLGVRGVFISAGRPPAGLSPADPALDPWYATLAEANVSLVFHAGGGAGFMSSEIWGARPEFTYRFTPDCESAGGPYMAAGIHVAEENFITVMVLGGVLERHPTLRVGAIELFAHWIGPLAERLDFFCDKGRHMDWLGAKNLSLKPSEYLNRQVRVTPAVYEPVEKYVERYPYLEDVYCYSTDYPHPEGNKWSMKRFYDRLAPHVSDRFLEKFFVTNGQLLVP